MRIRRYAGQRATDARVVSHFSERNSGLNTLPRVHSCFMRRSGFLRNWLKILYVNMFFLAVGRVGSTTHPISQRIEYTDERDKRRSLLRRDFNLLSTSAISNAEQEYRQHVRVAL